jgi:glycosyltransferase involved in cell wall biosynthesis
LEGSCDSNIVSQTGSYERSELVEKIEGSGANVFLFPSVWPETFSYVTQELMCLDVPIVCFDLGAPAERVRQYAKGWVIPLAHADVILDDIISFHDAIILQAEID